MVGWAEAPVDVEGCVCDGFCARVVDAGELPVVDVPADNEGIAGGGMAIGTLLARVWQKRRRSGSS